MAVEKEPRFEEIREEIEARQRNTVWPDALKSGSSVDAFLWKGDPYAKPIQRAGLVVFALTFLLLAICVFSIPFQKNSEDGWWIEFLMGSGACFIALRLFRNACLHSREPRKQEDD